MAERFKRQTMAADSSRYSLRTSRLPHVEQKKTPQARNKERETLNSNRSASRLRHASATNLVQTSSTSSLDLRPSSSQAPLRRTASVSNLRTPVKSTPTKTAQQLSEQAKRAATAENSQKILRILQQDDTFYNKLALHNGLKSMTAKQFLDIIGHLMQLISGKKLITGRQTDYETDILNFIKSLSYPYLVNKSWLRTPNAPHAYHECVTLLAWLCDFVNSEVDDSDDDSGKAIIHDRSFPSPEFTKMFNVEVLKGFYLWNAKQDDFSKMKTMLINEYISKRMHDKLKSADEVLARVDEMKKHCDEAKKVECYVKNEKKFTVVEEQYIQYEKKISDLEKSCAIKADELASIEIACDVKREKLAIKQKNIENLMSNIRSQKRSVTEMRDLNMKLTAIKNSTESLKQEILSIKNEDVSNQVKIARIIQRKTDATAKLNKIFYKISEILVKCKVPVPVNQLHINPNATLFEIQEIKEKSEHLLRCVKELKKQRDSDLNSVDMAFRTLILHEKQLIENGQKQFDNLDKQTKMIRKVEAEITGKNHEITCGLDKLTDLLQPLRLAKTRKLEDIQNKNRRCIEIERDTQRMLEAGERRAMELIEMKQQIIEDLDKAIYFVDSFRQNGEDSE